jgi:hypothetical protein
MRKNYIKVSVVEVSGSLEVCCFPLVAIPTIPAAYKKGGSIRLLTVVEFTVPAILPFQFEIECAFFIQNSE